MSVTTTSNAAALNRSTASRPSLADDTTAPAPDNMRTIIFKMAAESSTAKMCRPESGPSDAFNVSDIGTIVLPSGTAGSASLLGFTWAWPPFLTRTNGEGSGERCGEVATTSGPCFDDLTLCARLLLEIFWLSSRNNPDGFLTFVWPKPCNSP
jgi:hypothetical protein